MTDFKHKGFTYQLFIRPWKKKGKYEAIKWKTGLKFTWERISYIDYMKAKKEKELTFKSE